MTRGFGTLLLVASFLLGITVFGQRVPAARFYGLAAPTSTASCTTGNIATPVGGISCVCNCGINCDGSCAFDTGNCIYFQDAITCVANCCAAAPRPGAGECGGPGGILP